MKLTTFIYALTEPGSRVIRYFGKANYPQERRTDHIREARQGKNVHVACWIRKLLKTGQRPDVHVLCEVPRDDFARFERAFIFLGREYGLDLTNVADGGEDPPALRGAANPNFGKKYSPERLEKMRLATLGRKATTETREKLRIAGRGRKHTKETLEKMKGRKHTVGELAKMRASQLGRKHSEQTKNKLRFPKSEETRRKMRLAKLNFPNG